MEFKFYIYEEFENRPRLGKVEANGFLSAVSKAKTLIRSRLVHNFEKVTKIEIENTDKGKMVIWRKEDDSDEA